MQPPQSNKGMALSDQTTGTAEFLVSYRDSLFRAISGIDLDEVAVTSLPCCFGDGLEGAGGSDVEGLSG